MGKAWRGDGGREERYVVDKDDGFVLQVFLSCVRHDCSVRPLPFLCSKLDNAALPLSPS